MLFFLPSSNTGAGTYTTSSLSTKSTTTSDPPNICKVKPQQLQTSSLPSASHFSQLSCMPSLIAQQQQSPQVYVSQSAAGNISRFGYRNLENKDLCFFLHNPFKLVELFVCFCFACAFVHLNPVPHNKNSRTFRMDISVSFSTFKSYSS